MTPSTLPSHIAKQIAAGLDFTKVKTSNDKVATTAEVTGPQVTPQGSPIDGQVAVTKGSPVEQYVTIIVDTTAFDETDDVTAVIGDASGVHESDTTEALGSSNLATVYIDNSTSTKYQAFLNRLCSTPYTLTAFNLQVTKTAGAGSGTTINLPQYIKFSRKNLNGVGNNGRIDVANFENLEAFPRNDVRYTDISLNSEANLFDRDTQWTIPGLVGKRLYKFTLYVGFRKDN